MKTSDIKVGRWYETKLGTGKCTSSGRTHPPSVMVHITTPVPRGVVTLSPRDVYREVPEPSLAPQRPARPPMAPTFERALEVITDPNHGPDDHDAFLEILDFIARLYGKPSAEVHEAAERILQERRERARREREG